LSIRPAKNLGVFDDGPYGVLSSTKCATTLRLTGKPPNRVEQLDHRQQCEHHVRHVMINRMGTVPC